MIQLVGLEKRFGHKLLFEGLSWHLTRGTRVGLVGPNGAGKTTLLRIIAGRTEHDGGQIVRSRGVKIGLLEQEQDFSTDRSVLEEVEQASPELRAVQAEIHTLEQVLDGADPAQMDRYGQLQDRWEALGGYTAEAEARQVLCGLGFEAAELGDLASRFSGGWRMRIALARLLLSKPDVLLLDEPTNHLDIESIEWLESHLQAWDGAVVQVSHDRWYLNRACERVAELGRRGVRVYVGNYDKYLEQREKDLELLSKQRKQQQREIEKTEKFIERFRFKSSKAAAVQSRVKALEKVDRIELPENTKSMRGFRFPQPERTGRVVAELTGATCGYGDNVVYEGLDLTIERGWKVALVGVNGAGKSTLLKVLAGELALQAGERRMGHRVTHAYFGQHQLEELNLEATVMEEMAEASDIETYPLVRGLLGAFLFSGEDVEKPVGVLSGGEKARLALARLLLRPKTLLLLDEPTSHLDLRSRASLEGAVTRYQGTVVVVSHDRYFMNEICTHVLEVSRGHVRWYPGDYDDYLWKKKVEAEAAAAGEGAQTAGAVRRTSHGLEDKGAKAGGARDDQRDKKRREAEARKRVYVATQQLKKELDQIQVAIDQDETRMGELDALLADPATYTDSARSQALAAERGRVEGELGARYERWEALELAIEAATEAALVG